MPGETFTLMIQSSQMYACIHIHFTTNQWGKNELFYRLYLKENDMEKSTAEYLPRIMFTSKFYTNFKNTKCKMYNCWEKVVGLYL